MTGIPVNPDCWGTGTRSGAQSVRIEFKTFSPPMFEAHVERRTRHRPARCRTRKVKTTRAQWMRKRDAAARISLAQVLEANSLKTVTK